LSEVTPSGLLCAPATESIKTTLTGLVDAGGGCYSTSAITDMNDMFWFATFNNPVPMDTSSVTNMEFMFAETSAFNQPLAWDTSSVTKMGAMFFNAYAFNQSLAWDTSSVADMAGMFSGTAAFNQPLAWDTLSVTQMFDMFSFASAFAQELDAWDVGAVTNFDTMFQDSRMRAEAVPGGPGFGRACRIHYSWKEQNAAWDPVAAMLVADASELASSLCAPHLVPLEASSSGDPHLAFAHGGTADFRGCEGCYFNLLSTQDLLVNARTSLATFELKGSTVHGSFLTEVHIAWNDAPTQRWLNASFWAAEVGDHNFGWRAVNLTCGSDPDERAKAMYYNTRRACGAATLARGYSSLTVELPEWRVSVTPQLVFGHLEGPRRRLDLSLVPRVPEAELATWPHGLIGQSFDGDGAAPTTRSMRQVYGHTLYRSAFRPRWCGQAHWPGPVRPKPSQRGCDPLGAAQSHGPAACAHGASGEAALHACAHVQGIWAGAAGGYNAPVKSSTGAVPPTAAGVGRSVLVVSTTAAGARRCLGAASSEGGHAGNAGVRGTTGGVGVRRAAGFGRAAESATWPPRGAQHPQLRQVVRAQGGQRTGGARPPRRRQTGGARPPRRRHAHGPRSFERPPPRGAAGAQRRAVPIGQFSGTNAARGGPVSCAGGRRRHPRQAPGWAGSPPRPPRPAPRRPLRWPWRGRSPARAERAKGTSRNTARGLQAGRPGPPQSRGARRRGGGAALTHSENWRTFENSGRNV